MKNIFHRRQEDRLPARVLAFFKRFFIVMGIAATVMFVLLVMTLDKAVHYVPPSLPNSMILTYTFKPGLEETITKPALSQPLLRPATTFHEVINDLAQASGDPRVKGFVARLQDTDMSPAQIQELRDTLVEFRKAGKFAFMFAEDFGGFSSGMRNYYMAAAFDQIWLQPVGAVSINGVSAEVPFLKELMGKIGVEAAFSHRGIYKSAPESLTETGMSAPHRDMMTGMVNDLADQMVAGIAQDRKMTAAFVRQLIDGAPYTDAEALKLGLIDRIGYEDEMHAHARTVAGAEAEVVGLLGYSFKSDTIKLNLGVTGFISKFFRKSNPAYVDRNKAKIALIFGAGDIVSYRTGASAGFGEGGMSADKITAAFRAAREDKSVAAVVFRIDSPGGSPSAAEAIRRAVMETQKKGKPVIVSMGGTAASGGYWIATPADKIIAEPATITGSVGVFGGKLVLEHLWKKLGVNWETAQSGNNARMWSSHTGFSAAEKLRFDALLDNIYESFIARVMEGRKMTRAQVIAAAEGRAWTGRQAKALGLVDELGGLDRAIEAAKESARLAADQDVPVEVYPEQKSTIELFIQLATEGVSFAPRVDISAGSILRGLGAEGILRGLGAEGILRGLNAAEPDALHASPNLTFN